MADTTFTCPNLTTFLGLDALGPIAADQCLETYCAVIEYRMSIGVEDSFARRVGPRAWREGPLPGVWPTCRWAGSPPDRLILAGHSGCSDRCQQSCAPVRSVLSRSRGSDPVSIGRGSIGAWRGLSPPSLSGVSGSDHQDFLRYCRHRS